jgi:alpha,alpha-trehalose phosphorylase
MLHHERLRPPSHDYPADEWNVIEKAFHPEFLAQLESMLALGNGYLGMRGCPEEGGPNAENGTFINGFYETRPIVYGEEAYGFAKTGQTICNVTDSKIIKLFVDDEPFWLPSEPLKLRPAAQHEVRDAGSGGPLGDSRRQAGIDHIAAFGFFCQ